MVTANAAPAITTQYGPRPDGEYTTATLFIKTKDSQNKDTIAYYHHDHLGTPIQATDRSGIIVWSAQYSAFGQATLTTPQATEDKPTIESNLRFPGQLEDAETGLYYNWHRYYDPEIGRYITQDPIGLVGGVNLYLYVGGNPVNLIDPTGLVKVSAWEHCVAFCAKYGKTVLSFTPRQYDPGAYDCACDNDTPQDDYENPGTHDPDAGGDPNPYNGDKELLPKNHEELWKNSRPSTEKPHQRWTKEGTGKKARYHRFQKNKQGKWHWNGSSCGKTKSGAETKMREDDIPVDVKRW